MRLIRTTMAGCALATALAAAQEAREASPSSTREGVYTPQQARRGAEVAARFCEHCHPPAYYKGRVVRAWEGNTVGALYDSVASTMPEDRPSSLKPQQYADLLAYMFELNEYPRGKTELPGDRPALGKIVIERRE